MKLKMYYELTISRKQLEERTFKDNLLGMVIYVMVDLSSWKRYKLTSGPIIIPVHLFTGSKKKKRHPLSLDLRIFLTKIASYEELEYLFILQNKELQMAPRSGVFKCLITRLL